MKRHIWIIGLILIAISSSIAVTNISSPSTLLVSIGVTILILNGILVFGYFKHIIEKIFNNLEKDKKNA